MAGARPSAATASGLWRHAPATGRPRIVASAAGASVGQRQEPQAVWIRYRIVDAAYRA